MTTTEKIGLLQSQRTTERSETLGESFENVGYTVFNKTKDFVWEKQNDFASGVKNNKYGQPKSKKKSNQRTSQTKKSAAGKENKAKKKTNEQQMENKKFF